MFENRRNQGRLHCCAEAPRAALSYKISPTREIKTPIGLGARWGRTLRILRPIG